jgi:hypothetical protein
MVKFQKEEYLILEYDLDAQKTKVNFSNKFNTAISNWEYLTRISPIIAIDFSNAPVSIPQINLENKCHLIFFGLFNPENLDLEIFNNTKVWITHGLFNLICFTQEEEKFNNVIQWLEGYSIRHESWEIQNYELTSISFLFFDSKENEWRKKINEIQEINVPSTLRSCIMEYCALTSSILSRSEKTVTEFIDFFARIISFVESDLKEYLASNKAIYDVFSDITVINSGLTRFSSQTFAGITPIEQTEGHIWSHSLLGNGIPNYALFKIRKFVEEKIGELRIPVIIELLQYITDDVPNLLNINALDDFWSKDNLILYLANTKVSKKYKNELKEEIVPLITYFSGRDGYRSQVNTLSAPIESISSANTIEWSLITITHEISHTIIKGILPLILPNLADENDIKRSIEIAIVRDCEIHNLLEEIKRVVLISILDIELCSTGKKENELEISNESDFIEVLGRWHSEIEEILAHVFDFMYFYSSDAEKYIKEIWISWSVLPNVKKRIHGYLVRTICAILSHYLSKGLQAEEYCYTVVLNTFSSLKEQNGGIPVINEASEYLEDNWDLIKEHVAARRQLVKIAKAFLYSESMVKGAFGEEWISINKNSIEGIYNYRKNILSRKPMSNPLLFIKQFSNSLQPSSIESLWIYYNIVFNYE